MMWCVVEFGVMEKGEAGPREGTKYDMSQACPRCGTGARQITPLTLRASDVPGNRPIAQTLDRDLLIREDLSAALSQATGKRATLWPVLERRTEKPLPWWQLVPQYTFPKADPSSEGFIVERQCQECRRDGHFSDPGRRNVSLVYQLPKRAVEELPHICATWECFGNSSLTEDPPGEIPQRVIGFARPLLIVSEVVAGVLHRASTKVAISPVRFS